MSDVSDRLGQLESTVRNLKAQVDALPGNDTIDTEEVDTALAALVDAIGESPSDPTPPEPVKPIDEPTKEHDTAKAAKSKAPESKTPAKAAAKK